MQEGLNYTKIRKVEFLNYTKIRNVKSPIRGTQGSAGIDLFIPEDFNEGKTYNIFPFSDILIPMGIKFKIPENHGLMVYNKSGVATKKKLIKGAELIDSDYYGEVFIHLINTSSKIQEISPGDKIIQVVLIPISDTYIEEIENEEELYKNTHSERGEGAMGSTGEK